MLVAMTGLMTSAIHNYMPVRLSLSEGTVGDCTQAHSLVADLAAQYLLADRD